MAERADALRIKPLMLRPRTEHVVNHPVEVTDAPREIADGEGITAIQRIIAGVGHGRDHKTRFRERNGPFENEIGALAGRTFGLGFAIRTSAVSSITPGGVGSFSWAGHWGTQFWIDPAEQLIGLQMIQAAPGRGRAAVPFKGIHYLVYGALTVPESAAAAPPAIVSPETLADYVGTYDFGGSVGSRDRQGLADGKTGWLGIERFVAMEPEGLRINRPDPGGPVIKAGMTPGDLITELDGAPLKGLSLTDVLAKLRGPANTATNMKIVHQGHDRATDLSVVRAARRINPGPT